MSSAPPSTSTNELTILCPHCRKPNPRRLDRLRQARFCQHCGRDVVLNNDGPRYYITKVIKEGGQGAVYQAVDDQMKIYAVKEMLDRFFDPKEREEAIARFEAEARMLQSFNHPRIPRVYADFKDDERQYLVMDFVRGEDLEDIVKRDGRIPEAQVLIWADQICDVLELLHRQNPPIIFRDMKPSNIMIERDGNGVKLIDFGIAKVFAPSVRGTQIGTPGYAPPEQYQGNAAIESDIYALGATLHHLLTGRDPRDFPTEMFKFPPVRTLNPAVSEHTAQAVEHAVQINLEDRFHSVAEFRAALRSTPAVQPRPQPQQPPRKTQPIPAMPIPSVVPPPVAVARPATQAVPQAKQATAAMPQAAAGTAVAAPAKPTRNWRGQIMGAIFALIVIALIAATVIALPGVSSDLLPRLQNATATAAPALSASFAMSDEVLMVPDGQDVRAAFTARFLELAKAKYGPSTVIVQNGTLGYVGGDPVEVGVVEGGKQYRASMQGYVSYTP